MFIFLVLRRLFLELEEPGAGYFSEYLSTFRLQRKSQTLYFLLECFRMKTPYVPPLLLLMPENRFIKFLHYCGVCKNCNTKELSQINFNGIFLHFLIYFSYIEHLNCYSCWLLSIIEISLKNSTGLPLSFSFSIRNLEFFYYMNLLYFQEVNINFEKFVLKPLKPWKL